MEKNISQKLHDVMTARNWRQNRVAEELGTSPAHVNRLLKGTYEPSKPLAKLIDHLAKGDNVSSDPVIRRVIVIMESIDYPDREKILHYAEDRLERKELKRIIEEQRPFQQKIINALEDCQKELNGEPQAERTKTAGTKEQVTTQPTTTTLLPQ